MTFRAPLDDILFTLQRISGAQDLPDWDSDLAAEILSHFARFAEGVLAPLDATGDAQGCRFASGRVTMPDGFAAAYAELAAQGWQGLTAPEDLGGQGISPVVLGAVTEIFSGANHALQMVTGLAPGATAALLAHGTAAQQADWGPRLASGEVLATMCLTEPGAGSDLAAIRCRAVAQGGGWRISGEKIFISGGDQDLTDEILHLVLARSGGAGVKGLSLFLCPSHIAGRRNGVQVQRIEEKLGLHASPTCQMRFDEAEAELIGVEGQGLAAMFTMMDHARLDVAMQGVAHAARAADLARSYAVGRVQGRDAAGAPVAIAAHDDVAQMLDEADALALGGRAMAQRALVALAQGQGDLAAALTPICKVFCTEAGIRAADLAIQVLGGYGYLTEYAASQNWRDARICAIYEGSNGIHARTLATRLLRHQEGAALNALATWCEAAPAAYQQAWGEARAALLASDRPEAVASAFMALSSEMVFQMVWQQIADQAADHPDPARLTRLAAHVARRGRVRLSGLLLAVTLPG